MTRKRLATFSFLGAGAAIGLALFVPLFGQFSRVLIVDSIDESKLVTLAGNTRPEARTRANDRGIVPDSFVMEHMFLQLRRPPVLEAEFVQRISQMHDKTSPNFRQWMTPKQIGDEYGPAQQDLDTIKSWLQSKGFTVHHIYETGMVIDFSGTAGTIRQAFHTEIHNLEVDGKQHWANMRDPQIPAALAPAVVGVVSMHNFFPHPMYKTVDPNYTFTSSGSPFYSLLPADIQTIYNVNPLLRQGINGKGQTVVVIEDSTVRAASDVTTYRSTFLSKYATPALVQSNPTGTGGTCTNPGANGADIEADLDAEIVSAIAPLATVNVAACKDTTSTFGGLIALENLVSEGTPPAIMSISYGECEAVNGSSSNAAFSSAYQSAAAAGVSVFVSSGDESAASCDANKSSATHGIGVSGFTSTPYNVSVGGTDFEDTYNATKGSPAIPVSTYWNSTNTPTDGSAKSYVPEIPWNDSCASWLIANFEGSSVPAYCNTSSGSNFLTTGSGSGGPSGCATGSPSTSEIVSGTCKGWPKPSWQQGIAGNPADGVRDIPDVSLFASNGVWGHDIIICAGTCTGAPSGWEQLGGTSASSPMMAGIQALVNQKWNIRAGNPNFTYYAIANTEFSAGGNSLLLLHQSARPSRSRFRLRLLRHYSGRPVRELQRHACELLSAHQHLWRPEHAGTYWRHRVDRRLRLWQRAHLHARRAQQPQFVLESFRRNYMDWRHSSYLHRRSIGQHRRQHYAEQRGPGLQRRRRLHVIGRWWFERHMYRRGRRYHTRAGLSARLRRHPRLGFRHRPRLRQCL